MQLATPHSTKTSKGVYVRRKLYEKKIIYHLKRTTLVSPSLQHKIQTKLRKNTIDTGDKAAIHLMLSLFRPCRHIRGTEV